MKRYLCFGDPEGHYEAPAGWDAFLGAGRTVQKAMGFGSRTTHITRATPGKWTHPSEIMMTSIGWLSVTGADGEQERRPSWAAEPPDDAPPRPSPEHWWWRARLESSYEEGWAEIVDLKVERVTYRLGDGGWAEVPEQ